jgi:hypothetical protein
MDRLERLSIRVCMGELGRVLGDVAIGVYREFRRFGGNDRASNLQANILASFEEPLAKLCAGLINLSIECFDVLKGQFLSTVCTNHCALALID